MMECNTITFPWRVNLSGGTESTPPTFELVDWVDICKFQSGNHYCKPNPEVLKITSKLTLLDYEHWRTMDFGRYYPQQYPPKAEAEPLIKSIPSIDGTPVNEQNWRTKAQICTDISELVIPTSCNEFNLDRNVVDISPYHPTEEIISPMSAALGEAMFQSGRLPAACTEFGFVFDMSCKAGLSLTSCVEAEDCSELNHYAMGYTLRTTDDKTSDSNNRLRYYPYGDLSMMCQQQINCGSEQEYNSPAPADFSVENKYFVSRCERLTKSNFTFKMIKDLSLYRMQQKCSSINSTVDLMKYDKNTHSFPASNDAVCVDLVTDCSNFDTEICVIGGAFSNLKCQIDTKGACVQSVSIEECDSKFTFKRFSVLDTSVNDKFHEKQINFYYDNEDKLNIGNLVCGEKCNYTWNEEISEVNVQCIDKA